MPRKYRVYRHPGWIVMAWLCCWLAFAPGPASAAPELSLIAGNTGGQGAVDGTGAAARFRTPTGIAADAAGNLYSADSGNHTIRRITPEGDVTTLAGAAQESGSVDGSGAAARFNAPFDIAAGAAGNLYVADSGNHTIRAISPSGEVTTLAGTAGSAGSADGSGAAARLNTPGGIAASADGNLYVADSFNHVIRRITPAGEVTTLAGMALTSGSADGTATAARFNTPVGIAVDAAGNVYVADTGNHVIRRITPEGDVTTLAGTAGSPGSADGNGVDARLNTPFGVAVDAAGNVYVGDTGNYTIRKITAAGTVTTLAGTAGNAGSVDGGAADARFHLPSDIATDGAGNVFAADTGNNAIRRISQSGNVATLAGSTTIAGSDDGSGAAARFSTPVGVAADASGNLYVADMGNHAVRKVTPAGTVTTLAGMAGSTGSTDGNGMEARFNMPAGVAADAAGNLYITDAGNHTIRKVSPAGTVTTLAGTAGSAGSADGSGTAAKFDTPTGITVDAAGNLYVADTGNHTVRKLNPAGEVTTLAGTPGSFSAADGMGAAARFSLPFGIAADAAGTLYVADLGNHAIRKIAPDGAVSTLAGSLEIAGSSDGNGAGAQFKTPVGIAVDATGNLVVADTGNHTIRAISPSGAVTTLAGVPGKGGITLGTLPGGLEFPVGVAHVGPTAYVITTGHSVVRLTIQ